MRSTTVVRRAALSGLAAAALVAVGAGPASAHVTVTPSTTAAGAVAVLTVEVPHGCAGSATRALSLRLPDGVREVTAADTDRWAVEQTADALTWTTDEPLPDGEHAEVELSLRLPDEEGATLVLPVVQRCLEGEAAWTEVAEDGAGHDDLERPAPVLVVTAGAPSAPPPDESPEPSATPGEASADAPAVAGADATLAAGGTEDGTAADAAPDEAHGGAATPAAPADPVLGYGAAGVLVAAALAVAVVLLRRHRRS
ncbi:YcnI family protein [Promicromonospora citrea]|uniref:YncI copper-binding domain-containing protein n=2 Tax=Promicromonospora citrea TaxID=43677 RepID=A0A8H9GGK7_9MICO|nr:YcnI family protein [Promicromonospora citrea]GGM24928.1 hypothetical protein GCM10010102_20650 [Promicromonospora citrea]